MDDRRAAGTAGQRELKDIQTRRGGFPFFSPIAGLTWLGQWVWAMRILFGFLLAVVLGGLASSATAGERVALVFSAQKYEFLRSLDNPNHDAQSVAEALERLGFDVTIEQDRSL